MTFFGHEINYFELLSSLISLTAVSLGARRKFYVWPIALVGTLLSCYVHYQAHLYSKSLLNIFRVFTSFYGWYQWLYGGKSQTKLNITKTTLREWVLWISGGIVGMFLLGSFFSTQTSADYPYRDAFYASFAFIAHFMLAKKKLETWVLFLILDLVYIQIYYEKGLIFFLIKYIIYLFLAVYGYFSWRKSYLEQR